MLNVKKLKQKMIDADLNQKQLAGELHISENTMSDRMKCKSDFTLKEITSLCKILNINSNSEKAEIFLA